MSKFIIEIKLADGNTKQVKVYVDNLTAELLNQCDARVCKYYEEEQLRKNYQHCFYVRSCW